MSLRGGPTARRGNLLLNQRNHPTGDCHGPSGLAMTNGYRKGAAQPLLFRFTILFFRLPVLQPPIAHQPQYQQRCRDHHIPVRPCRGNKNCCRPIGTANDSNGCRFRFKKPVRQIHCRTIERKPSAGKRRNPQTYDPPDFFLHKPHLTAVFSYQHTIPPVLCQVIFAPFHPLTRPPRRAKIIRHMRMWWNW